MHFYTTKYMMTIFENVYVIFLFLFHFERWVFGKTYEHQAEIIRMHDGSNPPFASYNRTYAYIVVVCVWCV